MQYNKDLKELNLAFLEEVGADFLANNTELNSVNFMWLTKVGNNFLIKNKNINRYEILKNCEIEIYNKKGSFDASIIKIKKSTKLIKIRIRKIINKILKKESEQIKVKQKWTINEIYFVNSLLL